MDDVLSDGIWGQELFDNNCYKEMQTHINLKNAVHTQSFKTISTDEAIKLLLCNNENLSDEKKRKIHHYQVNYCQFSFSIKKLANFYAKECTKISPNKIVWK